MIQQMQNGFNLKKQTMAVQIINQKIYIVDTYEEINLGWENANIRCLADNIWYKIIDGNIEPTNLTNQQSVVNALIFG